MTAPDIKPLPDEAEADLLRRLKEAGADRPGDSGPTVGAHMTRHIELLSKYGNLTLDELMERLDAAERLRAVPAPSINWPKIMERYGIIYERISTYDDGDESAELMKLCELRDGLSVAARSGDAARIFAALEATHIIPGRAVPAPSWADAIEQAALVVDDFSSDYDNHHRKAYTHEHAALMLACKEACDEAAAAIRALSPPPSEAVPSNKATQRHLVRVKAENFDRVLVGPVELMEPRTDAAEAATRITLCSTQGRDLDVPIAYRIDALAVARAYSEAVPSTSDDHKAVVEALREAKEHLREAVDKMHVFGCNFPDKSPDQICAYERRDRFSAFLASLEGK